MKSSIAALALVVVTASAGAQTFSAAKLPATSRDSFEVVYQGQAIGTFVLALNRSANNFVLTGQASLPNMGVSEIDSVTFDAATLAPISMVNRASMQGMSTVSTTTVANGKATGTVQRPGPGGVTSAPVDATIAAGVVPDGAEVVLLQTLPLADGYTTSFKTFDGKSGEVKTYQLTVLGRETVSVAAGSVETFKVQLVSDETVTFFVSTAEPRRLMMVRLDAAGLEMRRVK